jgi:hypothetical protein
MTRLADTASRPLTMTAAVITAVLSFGAAADAEDYGTGIRLWTPDNFVGQGPLGGLHYFAPPAEAYATPFTGTPSKYPLPALFSGARVGVTLDGGDNP